MTEVALGLPEAAAAVLRAGAEHYGHRVVLSAPGAAQLAARVPELRPALAVVAATREHLDATVLSACDRHGVRLVVVASSPAEHRHAAALGVADAIDAPFTWELLAPARGDPAIDALAVGLSGPARRALGLAEPAPALGVAEPAPAVGRGARGRVVTVWGPAGAPGRTSIAIALAAELAERGVRVALGDADTHAASIAPALGLLDEAPGFAAACRLAGGGALSGAEFDRISQRHGRTGLRVLTGLGRPGRWPELTAERVAGTIEAARDWVEVLVLDVAAGLERDEELASDLAAPRRNAATLAAVEGADELLAVGAGDPIGLARLLRGRPELLERVEPARVTTVVNKVRPGAIGLGPEAQIRQTLSRFGGIDDPVLVPWDPAAFDAALLSGRTLAEVAGRSPARAAVRDRLLPRLGHPLARRGRAGEAPEPASA